MIQYIVARIQTPSFWAGVALFQHGVAAIINTTPNSTVPYQSSIATILGGLTAMLVPAS